MDNLILIIKQKEQDKLLNIEINNATGIWYFNSEIMDAKKNIADVNEACNIFNNILIPDMKELGEPDNTDMLDNYLSIDGKIYDLSNNTIASKISNTIVECVEKIYNNLPITLESDEKKDDDISDELLKFVNSDKYIKQNMDFEWKKGDNLNNVTDESLKVVLELMKRSSYKLNVTENEYILSNNIESLCTKKVDNKELLENIDSYIKADANGSFTVKKDLTVNRMCVNCKFQRCPKHLLLYIHYLASKGKLEAKLKERKENYNSNEYYTFDWKYNEVLKYIPEKLFDFCNELANKNLIYVTRYLVSNDVYFRIYVPFTCSELKIMDLEKDKLYMPNDNVEKWNMSVRRNPKIILLTCRNMNCALPGCVITLSGLLLYLKNSGREKEIEEQRKYYLAHKEECDKKYNELIQGELESYYDDSQVYLKKLSEYSSVKNISNLVSMISNISLRNLFITIEGDDKKIKNDIIKNIFNVLCKCEKIQNIQNEEISLYNLASENAYPVSNKDGKEKDNRGVLYRSYEELRYTELKQQHLYVVNDISEFLNEYKSFVNKNNSGAYNSIKYRQFKHVLELLTDISKKYYIIIEGKEKEIDELFKIEPRLQYIYQNNRYIVPEFSLEDSFNTYIESLNNELVEKIKKDKERYKKSFLEYVSLNKTFIPFDNRELASYLAMYSNVNNDVVFPENMYKKETVDESLKKIIGLDSVKAKIKEFEKYMLFKVKAEASNIKLASSNMHMIFTGNPGTGKTTIARIMAKMLYDMGIIAENKLVEVERKDLVAEYIGQTATKTAEVIEKAMGGVLFVDEAYTLSSESKNDFGAEAVATLIKAMEDNKDKFVVIFAGYKNEMKSFLDINPGIASRIGYTFDFEDYNTDELIKIFYKKIESMGLKCNPECEIKLNEICSYFSKRKAFGNGRFIDKLIQATLLKHANNCEDNIDVLVIEDIPSIKELNNSNDNTETTEDLLKDIIGLDNLKKKIKEFEDYVKFIAEARKNGINIPNQNMHMIFTGNPGTGKTTIARIMAKILYNAGIIYENKLVEVEKKDLIGKYAGETALKTTDVIEKAMGGILFIDEAYSLTASRGNQYGTEAVDTLIKAMEDHKGEFIVIFAGYKKEMSEFIEMNSGIYSRIGYTFNFEDYSREELAEILYLKIEKSGLKISEDSKEKVKVLMNYFAKVENIGNGRFVEKVFQEILLKHSKSKDGNIEVITDNDIPSIKEMTDSLFNGENMINPDSITEESLRKTAIHEIGHALIRYKLFDSPEIIKITINSEGTGALGYVQMRVKEGEYIRTKSRMLKDIMVSLGGMVSEEVFIGEFANGNSSDLEKATTIAYNMITRYGMSNFGYGKIFKVEGEVALEVQKEINEILKDCFEKTKKIIEENKEKMLKVIDYLYDKREIDEETFIEVFNS